MRLDDTLPQPPALEFCFEARVSIDAPLVIDPGPHALRRIIPIKGGTVKGPRFEGRVLAGGADWQYVRHDDVLALEAKYTLESHDGVLIMVTNSGMRHGPPEVIAKLTRGEPVAPAAYYFRTVPSFEAPAASAYAWMNKAIFLCTAERQASLAIVQFFRVL
jgi:hypothetical protein